MDRILEIEKEIESLQSIIDEKEKKYWDNFKFNKNTPSNKSAEDEYNNYLKLSNPERKKISSLDREKRLLIIPEFSDLSNFGDVMSLKEFIECVNCGDFIDYDGFGLYIKDNQESNIEIYPSDVKNNSIRKDFDTIIWFNR